MKDYYSLKEHYENKLMEFGPNSRGMDWPNPEDLKKRFEVLTRIVNVDKNLSNQVSLLDLGCGVGLLIDFLAEKGLAETINYQGIDISSKMVDYAIRLHPKEKFIVQDILEHPLTNNSVDYVIMNGLLTEKREMSQEQMISFAKRIIKSAYDACKKGVSFNIMSSHVDWKRDDLFHWELDEVVGFLVKNCSRKIAIFMDYELYEYTVHVKK